MAAQKRTELVKLRQALGLSQVELAARIDVHVDTVRGWESGRHGIYLRHQQPLADALGVTIEVVGAIFGAGTGGSDTDRRQLLKLGALVALTSGAAGRVVASEAAEVLVTQRAATVRRLVSVTDAVERLDAQRLELIDTDNLLGPHHVIPAVREQLDTIAHLLRGAGQNDRRRLLTVHTHYAEFLAWLHQDAGSTDEAQHWLDQARTWSEALDDTDTTVYILARKSQLAADIGQPALAIEAAQTARQAARPGSLMAAVAATYEAHGHAMRGHSEDCLRCYDTAYEIEQTKDDQPGYGMFLGPEYIAAYQAHSLTALGNHTEAIDAFDRSIPALEPSYHRDRGVYIARRAVAQAKAGATEDASASGLKALAIGAETRSGRILADLATLDTTLRQQQQTTEFQAAVDDLRRKVPA